MIDYSQLLLQIALRKLILHFSILLLPGTRPGASAQGAKDSKMHVATDTESGLGRFAPAKDVSTAERISGSELADQVVNLRRLRRVGQYTQARADELIEAVVLKWERSR